MSRGVPETPWPRHPGSATSDGIRETPSDPAGRLARPLVLRLFGGIREGRLDVQLPGGEWIGLGPVDSPLRARARILRHDFFRRILFHGEIGAGESYVAGDWRADDLPAVLEIAVRNRRRIPFEQPASRLSGWLNALRHRWNANSRRGSRRNIRAHYDLGNDFYRLFLDSGLAYSSAWFEEEGQPLEAAQAAKYRRLLGKLGLAPGAHLLEIGCGWGGMALQAAGEAGLRVTGITLSGEQLRLARDRVAAAGLEQRVDLHLRDYRDLTGRYDGIVSVEMFEAVGWEYYDAFFGACRRVLKPGGRLVLQTITAPEAGFHDYRRGSDWIRRHVFPGSLLASPAEIGRSLGRVGGLTIIDSEEIGPHYVPTLAAWRRAFHARRDEVRRLGFDDTFIRTWDYYLASCEAGFRSGAIGNVQMVIQADPD